MANEVKIKTKYFGPSWIIGRVGGSRIIKFYINMYACLYLRKKLYKYL